MRTFEDETGTAWTASAMEESTPRHHGRWFLIFEGGDGTVLPMPEVRWQTRATADRTLRTMSVFELRRRVHVALERARLEEGASPDTGAGTSRARTSASAG